MINNILNMLNPQMRNSYQTLYQQAQASGNPQQFLEQRFGNNQIFAQGFKILNEQGAEGLNKFISSHFGQQ